MKKEVLEIIHVSGKNVRITDTGTLRNAFFLRFETIDDIIIHGINQSNGC